MNKPSDRSLLYMMLVVSQRVFAIKTAKKLWRPSRMPDEIISRITIVDTRDPSEI